MRRVLVAIGVVFLAAASRLEAQSYGAGQAVGVVDGPTVSIQNNSAIVSGWAFHTGGAAIVRVRVWLDCNPFAAPGCELAQLWPYYIGYMRPDVVAAYPAFRVPENSGWIVGLAPWFAIADGPHWIYAGVTDAEHGAAGWTQINPVCFVKFGGNVRACGGV